MTELLLTAHTGNDKTSDNSIESVIKGIALGADIVEVDVRFLEDRTPYISHEPIVVDKQSIVTLEAVFIEVSKHEAIKINLDMKEKDTRGMMKITELGRQYDLLGRLFYTGISFSDVAVVQDSTPEIPYLIACELNVIDSNSNRKMRELARRVQMTGAIGGNFCFLLVNRNVVEAFHELGLKVYVWTVNGSVSVHRMIYTGVDSVTTRSVEMVYPMVNKERKTKI